MIIIWNVLEDLITDKDSSVKIIIMEYQAKSSDLYAWKRIYGYSINQGGPLHPISTRIIQNLFEKYFICQNDKDFITFG